MNQITPSHAGTQPSTSGSDRLHDVAQTTQPGAARSGLKQVLETARLEAAALAWSTDFPFLLLPCLQEELENEATNYWSKQIQIQRQSLSRLHETFPIASRRLAA